MALSVFRDGPSSGMDYRIFNVRRLRDHSYACVYTQGLDTLTTSQHNILTRKKISQTFLVLRTGFERLDLESMLYQLNHPVNYIKLHQKGMNKYSESDSDSDFSTF